MMMSAQKRLKRVSFGDTPHYQNGDRQIHDILEQLNQANTATGIEEVGSELLRHIKKENIKKKRSLEAQLREALRERDTALEAREKALRERDVAVLERDATVDKLSRALSENEVIKLQLRHMESERRKFDQANIHGLEAQVELLKRERVAMEGKLSAAQSELQNLHVIYSLHKSLSQEKVLKNQFTGTLDEFEHLLKQREAEVFAAQHHNQDLARRLEASQKERDELHVRVQELERVKFYRSPTTPSGKLKSSNRLAQSPTFQGSIV